MKIQLLVIVLLVGLFLAGCTSNSSTPTPEKTTPTPNYSTPAPVKTETTVSAPVIEEKPINTPPPAPPKSNLSAVIRPPQLAYEAQKTWGTSMDYRFLSPGERADLGEIIVQLTSAELDPKKAHFKLFDSKELEVGVFSMEPGEYVQIDVENGSKFAIWTQAISSKKGVAYAELTSWKLPS